MERKLNMFFISSCALHIIAMALMVCDHLWATLLGTQRWLTAVGRLAFPIFAFMIVEGFNHTSNIKKYMKRLLIFAVLSEIPFNYMMSGGVIGPFHQNVLWTFLISLLLILLIQKLNLKAENLLQKINLTKAKIVAEIIIFIVVCYIGYFVGNITFVDYFGAGILTVLVFYFFNKKTWYNLIFQIISIYYINAELLAGMYYKVNILGHAIEVPEQGLAVLALIPIWLYSGKQGYHAKWFKYTCYAFYPVHMLILTLLSRL